MASDEKKISFPQREEKILKFWEENKIFEKSLAKNKGRKAFVFYEGPPTANAAPGIHHVEARAFKDIIPRYKTMRGFFVPRRAGWDTHGLPVEIQVEKELGFKTKQDIEKYGIARFNQKAKESVWRHKEEWENLTRRIGFWLDLKNPYITYDPLYMESLWGIIKKIWKKGLLVEDFKVVPWCPRCGTALSSHELGQPGAYKLVKESSVFVKFKIKNKKNEYLLVWTTTPWTLPANVAVAVNPKIEYTKYKIENGRSEEIIWSATTPLYETGVLVEIMEKVSGKTLLGFKYEPLFNVPAEYALGKKIPFEVVAGDFVSTEDGTGMVHLAPTFGEEDLAAVKTKWGNSYPILQTVNPDGTMKKGIVGAGKFVKEADQEIIADLKRRGLLFKILPYEHDYPHCWRCDTPLLYFARNSWWVRVTALKEKMLAENEKINWIPGHLKHGRFGEFLKDLRDWAFSRERYWGTPLPVWRCESCKNNEVIGSRAEFARRVGPAGNRYFLIRHGEALSNLKNIFDSKDGKYPLTVRGRTEVEKAGRALKNKKIDLIFSSPLLRARQTAEILQKILGLSKIQTDKRLSELNPGVFEGQHVKEYYAFYSSRLEKFVKRPPGGESLGDVRKRMLNFLEELEKKYAGKNILIVSHEYPLWALFAGMTGLSNEEAVALRRGKRSEEFIKFAEVLEARYKKLPRDEKGEINLHRPYVDFFEFKCPKCGKNMKRIPEVADVWFDSGAMPFAQSHWPFAQNQKLLYPADYISEAVDQTRGWFYTLLAVAVLLGKGTPYRNVISLGHVLDKNGQKMSKSKSNVVDPSEMIKKYGADTLRWYFYAINSPGESKRFDEKDLQNKLRGFLMTFWNSFVLFDTYVEKIKNQKPKPKNQNILDKWVLAKLNLLVDDVTKKLDEYDATGAARAIESFVVSDFSQWYLRRSRRRFQRPNSAKEFNEAARAAANILYILSRLTAPFVPFLAEEVYLGLGRKIKLKEKSVHLENWPRVVRLPRAAEKILRDMQEVRAIAASALKERAEAGIKIRQPLTKLQITNAKLQKNEELRRLIKDEVNVKEIIFGKEFKLDTALTPELKEEGLVRELVRNVQEMRRDLGLKPRHIIRCQISGPNELEEVVLRWQAAIKKDTNSKEVAIGGKKIFDIERELDFEGQEFWIGISKA